MKDIKIILFLFALHGYSQNAKGECVEEVLYSGQYCATSADENCDGIVCNQVARQYHTPSLQECMSLCRNNDACNYISYTEANNKDCLMYDACPSSRNYGDGSHGTITKSVCAFKIEYVGCFNNHTPRIGGHLGNGHTHLTIEDCSDHTNEYFGMEYPQAAQTPGEAQCVPISSWPANQRRPDSECAAELDTQGRYLGGGHRIAIYRIVKDGLRNQNWNYEDEYVSSWNTEFFSNNRAKQLYESGELKSQSIDCDIQFRVQRDNTQSRTSFSFMTLHDGKIFNVNMQGRTTNHQNWNMEDDCRTLKCYDYEQSSPRGNSGYCPSEFYDGTNPKTLEVLLLRVNFRPEDMNGNSQPWRNKYTFKGTTYALHGPTEMPSSNPTKTPTPSPSLQPTITYPYPRSGTLGVASTNEWNFVNEDSTSYSVSIFSAEEQALLKSGSFEVHCDLSFRLQRDDSASSSSFTYLDLDTNTVHTQQMQGGYQDHQRFEMPSCSEITCHKSQWSSCPWTSKNAILLAVDFRPRSGHAHGSQWDRNKFTFTGTHYYVTQVSYDYVEVQNHHGCHERGNLGNIGRPTAQGIQKDARCEFVKLLNAFGNGCSHDLDVACPEGSNYDPQTVLCGGACGVACESICKESCDDSDVCVAFAIHGRYGPQMYDQRGVSCSDNQHGLTPSGGWTAFVKQVPTQSPTQSPTTDAPSGSPSKSPTPSPTDAPSASPSKEPTTSPTSVPTSSPTDAPSKSPSFAPSTAPTAEEFILKVEGFHGDASKALSDEAYAQKRVFADKINYTINRLKNAEEAREQTEVASEQSARAVPPATSMTNDDAQSEVAFAG